MAISEDVIRQRVAAAIGSDSEWREAPLAWGLYGRDPAQIGPHRYAVGVPDSRNRDPRPERNSPQAMAWFETTVAVRWSWTVPVTDNVAGYDAGLQAQNEIIASIYDMSRKGIPGFTLTSARRAIEATGKYLLGDLTFLALHMKQLRPPVSE